MTEIQNAFPIVRFGTFKVDFLSRELRKKGMRIRLEEKPFQILEMLIENAGQVVKRQRLCEKLWPDTYVSFDHNLNTAVNKLRDLLGDSAQNPRFVETVPHLGYRFVAPVECLNGPNGHRLPVGVHAANPSIEPRNGLPERQGHRLVMGSPVRHSTRPQRVRESPPQAKSCQTAP